MSWPEGNIMICRTDAIGDVVLTLPLSGYLKKSMPDKKVFFLGRTYTKPIIESCKNVDEFLNWDEIQHKEEKEIISLWGKWNIGIVLFVFRIKTYPDWQKKQNCPPSRNSPPMVSLVVLQSLAFFFQKKI
ncbi:MAG: hypothetical protein IPF52_09330 [Saprospiraceae bacterium]|nr:hypothetical protein [Saprospiraceae bacterium]